MGDVYRAWDAKLERHVAIKVLPELLASDPDRLARFEREAKSIAQLSHPNIRGVFDVGRVGTIHYVVLELLDGETLRERLIRGPLSSRKTLEYGAQVARGIAAAHAKGIVHRDVKPENLFITADDRVKILDFGLAKPVDFGPAEATNTSLGTVAGMVMGTVGYMAPEQVRGQTLDRRADIFAFGAVLLEMLTGRGAFARETPADTMSAILNSDTPDLETVSGDLSPLARIVRRCLEKKPELRFQSADDLAFALETISERSSGAVPSVNPPASRGSRAAVPWAIAAVAVVAAAAMAFQLARTPQADDRWARFTQITDAAGVETNPALSPDGATVAYAMRSSGSWDIYAQRAGERRATPLLADPERDEDGPAFSPDGRSIAYHDARGRGAIFIAAAGGDTPRRITDFGLYPAWSPDGRQLAFSTQRIDTPHIATSSTLWIVPAEGGAPRQVEGLGDAFQPSWAPSGTRIAYWSANRGQRDIYTVASGGGAAVPVTQDAALDWAPVWSPDGYLYFASDRGGSMNLWRIAVDERSGVSHGEPEPVTTGVQAAADLLAFSGDGSRMVFRSVVEAVNPVALPFDPVNFKAGAPVVLSNSNTFREPADVSPDGRLLSFNNIGEPREDIFIGNVDGSGMRRLTHDPSRDRMPAWAPDNRTLFFFSTRGTNWEIWRVDVDGGDLRRAASLPKEGLRFPIVSPAADRLVASGQSSVYLIRLGHEAPPEQLRGIAGVVFNPSDWSPDGTKLAGIVATPAGARLAIYDFAAERLGRPFEVPFGYARWLPDGRHVISLTDGGLQTLDTVTGQVRSIGVSLTPADSTRWDPTFAIARDGRAIYYGARRQEADIWLAERLHRN
jgi:Tol biopolymer transport system component